MEYPTPYPEVNALLKQVQIETQTILGSAFTGLYLYGSLAAGGFDPVRSDIDFLVVTEGELGEATILALRQMHARIAESGLPLATELEGSYIPRQALRRYDPEDARHPHLERGGILVVEQHDSDWIIQRHVLRERGVTAAGPDLRTLIDPVSPEELRGAALATLHEWWAPMIQNPFRLDEPGYRAYAILTMTRILYTLEHGAVVPKPAAARWAQSALGEPWAALIRQANAWPQESHPGSVKEAQDFIRYTLERGQRLEAGSSGM